MKTPRWPLQVFAFILAKSEINAHTACHCFEMKEDVGTLVGRQKLQGRRRQQRQQQGTPGKANLEQCGLWSVESVSRQRILWSQKVCDFRKKRSDSLHWRVQRQRLLRRLPSTESAPREENMEVLQLPAGHSIVSDLLWCSFNKSAEWHRSLTLL